MKVDVSKNIGYWPETLELILKGEKKLTRDEVYRCAEILYQNHRIHGNPNIPKCLKIDERRLEAIENLWTAYVELEDESDLVKRAKLLDSVFMTKLAKNKNCLLTDNVKAYILKDSIPCALSAVNARYLLDVDRCKSWIEQYRLACKFPQRDATQIHMELFEGYAPEEKAKLVEKRRLISQGWYDEGYKNNQVTKREIQGLHDNLQNFINNNQLVCFDNPYMGRAYYAYMIHAKDFPPEKQTIYWEAILSALEAFILRGS